MNADLHCHSTVSDGVLSPSELVARASANGVELFALTDHDELAGLPEAAGAAARLGLRFVPGVEVSVTWGGETIHVLGLNFDPEDPALVAGLARNRAGRDARAREMADRLADAGIPGTYEGALRHVGNPALVSRTHFARHLVERGVCASVGDVFQRYLADGLPGHVPHRWAALGEAVGWIRGAGGTAVLAHPGRYRLDDVALSALMTDFRNLGGAGIEVVCGSHRPDEYPRFARRAADMGFRASRGSDFHAPGEGGVEPGRLPPLPAGVVPVWSDW